MFDLSQGGATYQLGACAAMQEMTTLPDRGFGSALRREVVRSERRRMLWQAGVLAGWLAAMLLARVGAPEMLWSYFHERMAVTTVLVVLLPFIAYELLGAAVFMRLIRRERDFIVIGRYANALVETSLPTVILFVLARAIEPAAAFGAWPLLLYFVFIIMSTLRLDFALSAFTGGAPAAELFALAYWELPLDWRADAPDLTIVYHLTRSMALLVAGLLAGSVGARLKEQFARAIASREARDRLTNLFGQHVSPQVVDRLLAIGPAELSEIRRVGVMFLDIRNFTAAARERSPAEVVERLNEAFAILVEIVDRHGGIVNKFLGDGFLAMFDDPEAAAHAAAAAREMLRATEANNAGHPWPLRIGIGIHVGELVTGTVGSSRRKEYTVIGDTVNLAARLESLNKDLGSQLLVSQEVHDAAPAVTKDARPLGPVMLRGYAEPITVWRLA